jgi:hypothetical protein
MIEYKARFLNKRFENMQNATLLFLRCDADTKDISPRMIFTEEDDGSVKKKTCQERTRKSSRKLVRSTLKSKMPPQPRLLGREIRHN